MGASPNLYVQPGNQTLYWRAYSQYIGSPGRSSPAGRILRRISHAAKWFAIGAAAGAIAAKAAH